MRYSKLSPSFIAISGGVGGSKLALGLANSINPEKLMIVANIGDDFQHFGLHISPDIDTLMYTLSGKSDTNKGWGIANETWGVMDALEKIGSETWFKLGDNDFATHLERTKKLQSGKSLSETIFYLCKKFGIKSRVIPISDDKLQTIIKTKDGDLEFQEYFVKKRCKPIVSGFRFLGAKKASPNNEFMMALKNPDLKAVIICPSNPFISIDPILAVSGVRKGLRDCRVPVIAVSPIIGKSGIKGPIAKQLKELGHKVSVTTIANFYRDFINGFVIDHKDNSHIDEIESLGIKVKVCNILMENIKTKIELAQKVLDFSSNLGKCSNKIHSKSF